jgi:hypothetical protein
MENSKDIKSVIKLLNQIGYKIVEIEGCFYSFTKFEEANSNNWKHTLEGKDIDDVIMSFINYNQSDSAQRSIIVQKIDACPNVHKYFHKDFKYILHLS